MNHSIWPAARRLATFLLGAWLASGAIAQPDSRPFKAKLALMETVTFYGGPPCFGIASVQAVGNATHLGTVTARSHDCINPQGPNAPNSFSFSSIGTGPAGLVFTAANGDAVYASYSGTANAQASGPHLIAGQFIITGGTGRFLGATGGGTLTGFEDLSQIVTGRGEIEVIGVIVF